MTSTSQPQPPETHPAASTPVRRSLLGVPVEVTLRATHLAQMSVQALVFLYTALYWPSAAAMLPRMAALMAFGYAVDFALSALRYKSWRVGAGPVPVVLSSNLFVWFAGGHAWLHYAVVLLALACKHFVQRDGRHIFNPSAIGVVLVGIPCLLLPHRLDDVDISHALSATPNALEVAFLLSLISLTRVPVVLITLAAAAFTAPLLWTLPELFPGVADVPLFTSSAIYIGIALLITDPATTPRSPVGQILFGVVYITLFAAIASLLGPLDLGFWGKMLPLPVLNALAPRFDAWADRVAHASPAWLTHRYNRWHVAVWVAVVVALSFAAPVKRRFFLENRRYATEHPLHADARERRPLRRCPRVLRALQLRRRALALAPTVTVDARTSRCTSQRSTTAQPRRV